MSDNNVNNKLPRRKPVDCRVDFGFVFFLVILNLLSETIVMECAV